MGLDVEECSVLESDMDIADYRIFVLILWTQMFMSWIRVVDIVVSEGSSAGLKPVVHCTWQPLFLFPR